MCLKRVPSGEDNNRIISHLQSLPNRIIVYEGSKGEQNTN